MSDFMSEYTRNNDEQIDRAIDNTITLLHGAIVELMQARGTQVDVESFRREPGKADDEAVSSAEYIDSAALETPDPRQAAADAVDSLADLQKKAAAAAKAAAVAGRREHVDLGGGKKSRKIRKRTTIKGGKRKRRRTRRRR